MKTNIFPIKPAKTGYTLIMLVFLLFITAMFLYPSAARCEEKTDVEGDKISTVVAKFEKVMDEMFNRSKVPGAAVAIVYDDKVVFLKCYGVKKIGSPDKVDPDTVFQLASCSKAFSSAVIASLVKDGVINWDDKVTKHFPDFKLYDPKVTEEITVRDLLSHHSGLPSYAGDYLSGVFGYDRKEILHRLRFLKPTGEFRKTYAYQNYLITAAIETASRASGKKWDSLYPEKIFKPLGMTSTFVLYSQLIKSKNHSASHILVDGKMTPQPLLNDDSCAPAGGLSSSVSDMTKWVRMLLADGKFEEKTVIDAETLKETFKPQTLEKKNEKGVSHYGMCWFIKESDGVTSVEHGGELSTGIGTLVYMIPSEKLGLVVLTNAFPEGHLLTHALAPSLRDLYFKGECSKDWLTEMQDEMKIALSKKTMLDPFDHLPARPSDAKPNDELKVYPGEYENDYFGKVTIKEKEGSLVICFGKKNSMPLFPYDGDTFQEKTSNTGVIFTRDENGNISGLTVKMLDCDGRDGKFARKK